MKLRLAILAAALATSGAAPPPAAVKPPAAELADDGKKIWASNLGPTCGFEPGQTVVPDDSASYYCKGDIVRGGSRITLIPGGRCALGDFTPYSTAK